MERDIREFYRRTWFIAHLAMACAICVGYITGAHGAALSIDGCINPTITITDCFGSITTVTGTTPTTTTTLAPPPTTSTLLPGSTTTVASVTTTTQGGGLTCVQQGFTGYSANGNACSGALGGLYCDEFCNDNPLATTTTTVSSVTTTTGHCVGGPTVGC